MEGSERKEAHKEDLFKRRSWLISIAAFGESTTAAIVAYRMFIFMVLFYIFSMAICAIYFAAPNKVLMASACHVLLISIFVILITSFRLVTNSSMKQTNKMIKSGVYEYEDEDVDENLLNMKTRIEEEISKTSNFFSAMFATGGISNLTIYPWTARLFESDQEEDSILNPYLPPYLIYMPFNTRSLGGFSLAYFINVILVLYLYGITLCWLDIYIHCAVVLKVQFKMLNYSLQNIQTRAYYKFKQAGRNSAKEHSSDMLFEEKYFQTCLYSCFRSNVRHHQALIRFKRALQPFIGLGLLDMYLMAALIYATTLYLIVQDLPLMQLINLIMMLFTEQSKLFIMCLLGEAITDESGGLYETLYNLPWIQCNKSFNKAVNIMRCNTLEPFKLNATLIDKPANIKAYSEFMSTMYKIVNLVRQSEVT